MKQTLSVLNQLEKDGIIERYAVGGAMGATFYVEPFTTFDLDIFVIVPQEPDAIIYSLNNVYAHLARLGYVAEKECVLIEGIPVQFLPAYNQLLEEGLNEAAQVDYDGVATRVFTAEYLVAVALQTGRAKDRARVQMFLADEVLDTARLKEILRKHDLHERWLQWTNRQI